GDATLLELARVLDDHRDYLRRDVWVAWWPGHSTGRYAGSTWFTDEFAQELTEHCVAHVNIDSPGVADATEYDERVKWMAGVHDIAASSIEDVSGKETVKRRPPRAGDYSFNNLGIPGMSLQSSIPKSVRDERGYHPVGGSGGHADAWHVTTDTIDKADPTVLERDTEVYTLATARLSRVDLPADPLATIDHVRSVVADYDDVSEFDLEPICSE
ncbi:peptidase M28, partial [Halorubrum sp. Atlit-8R]|uniref:M28 family metallopeptidase n=1 Tax=Halorubrum sp. Atlit-8R TaxID=2282126 RepID=UPI000EF1BD21